MKTGFFLLFAFFGISEASAQSPLDTILDTPVLSSRIGSLGKGMQLEIRKHLHLSRDHKKNEPIESSAGGHCALVKVNDYAHPSSIEENDTYLTYWHRPSVEISDSGVSQLVLNFASVIYNPNTIRMICSFADVGISVEQISWRNIEEDFKQIVRLNPYAITIIIP